MLEEENRPEEPLKAAAMHTLNTHGGAWSNRAGMWPVSEKRLIFASKKENVTLQWIDNFQRALALCNGEELEVGEFNDGCMIDNDSRTNDSTI